MLKRKRTEEDREKEIVVTNSFSHSLSLNLPASQQRAFAIAKYLKKPKASMKRQENQKMTCFLMDFYGLPPPRPARGRASCYALQNPFNIIIHSLPSGDERETWEQSKLPPSISCLGDPSRSIVGVMVRLKLPPGATAMSEHNVSHWFLLKGPSHFASQSEALNCPSPPFSPSHSLLTHAYTSNFFLFFFVEKKTKHISLCFLPLTRNGRGGGRGREGRVEREGLVF